MNHKIRIIAMLVFIIGTICTNPAQSQFISYGVKGGLNLANVGGSDAPGSEMHTGFHAGAFLGVSLLGIVAAEGGAYFSQKGFTSTTSSDNKFISTYIDIPLVIKFSPLPLFHFYAGPQASILLDNKIQTALGSTSSTDGMRKLDMAVVVGVGVNIPGGLRVSGGYDYGFTSIDDDNRLEIYNRVIKLTVGYKF